MTSVPLTEAKARLNELVEGTVTTHQRVTITRHGRPAAVLISVEDLEAMEETLFWQSEPDALADLRAAREKPISEFADEAAIRRRFGVGRAG